MSSRPRPVPTEADVADAAALLGVAPGAPAAEVKRAWRSAVRVTHPDRVDGSARRAAEHLAAGLNEARDVLLVVARTSRAPTPFGAADGTPQPATGEWDAAVRTEEPGPAPAQPRGPAQGVPDLPRPFVAAPPEPGAGAHTVASGRPRPVRETIGIVVLLALVAVAAILVVYQFLGELLPL